MHASITVLPGDGIGPEVTREAEKALEQIASLFDHRFDITHRPIGGEGLDQAGDPLPDHTLQACRSADAVLLGAVGGPKWDDVELERRPERGLLRIRSVLELFANIRPTTAFGPLLDRSTLKPDIIAGLDIVIVRELTGGIYFGDKREQPGSASDLCTYADHEIERVARLAANIARSRNSRVTSVDKANVLATSRLWRRTVQRVFDHEFPDVELEHTLVDSTAMKLVSAPTSFDVILTENMFGDILSDQAAALTGTLGLAPSASMGAARPALFEPVHGSAPDIAGKGIANPLAAILSAAMLLRDGLGLQREARALEHAVTQTIQSGELPMDLDPAGERTTKHIGEAVINRLAAAAASSP